MSYVFLVDTNKKQLNPIHPGWARKLLKVGKASILKRFPFTLILKQEVKHPDIEPLRIKIDPGSNVTGIAILNDSNGKVVFGAEIEHRGWKIKESLESRRLLRQKRRNRKTRYRKPRFNNRAMRIGWLPPSLLSRVYNIITWVNRLKSVCNITSISQELVNFDTQKMQNPEITGIEYQQGKLFGYEVKEYLLEKWNRTCAYCDKKGIPLQVEHIVPKSKGGTNRVSNLTLACEKCNLSKSNKKIDKFIKNKNKLSKILRFSENSLKDAAAVNSTKFELNRRLIDTGLPVEVGSGALTKFNRIQKKLPKEHWIDAVCVGESTPEKIDISNINVLKIKAFGNGKRQKCQVNKFGVPIRHVARQKHFMGFRTGDYVKATVGSGKLCGVHYGRIVIKHKNGFNFKGMHVHPKNLKILQKADGYGYN